MDTNELMELINQFQSMNKEYNNETDVELESYINQLKNMPKNLLNLNFNEESWVEIYSADPSNYFQVVYKLFYENETYQLKVESPLVVVVGNASGVVGTFNDLPLDFSANANRLDVSVIRLSNG